MAIGTTVRGGTKDSRAAQFIRLFEQELQKFPKVNVHGVSMFFFPICYRQHYYILTFDMAECKIELIDNMEKSPKERYGYTIRYMINNFLAYLKHIKHRKLDSFDPKNYSRMEFNWQTKTNFEDCGVFATRHMETSMGGGTLHWKCGLVVEGDQ